MTAGTIITEFELQVNDVTELSAAEELTLLNRLYQKICADRPWSFLKKAATGTVSSDATGSYITIPSDFAYFVENNNYTDNSIGIGNNAAPKVIFMVTGSAYMPYQIINYNDRRQYVDRTGFAYYDVVNGVIRFTGTPTGDTYEFDYIKVPPQLATTDTPVFPGRFHAILQFALATSNDILQLSPKATSYAQENAAIYQSYLNDMYYWDAAQNMN